jgi:hypothetical protein
VQSGKPEALEKPPWSGGEFADHASPGSTGIGASAVKPLAGAHPGNDERELHRRAEEVDQLQDGLIQTEQKHTDRERSPAW